MGDLEDLERRVTAVEADLAIVREESAAARALATGADRAEMRGHTGVLAPLRATQLAHYDELKTNVTELKTDVAEIKAGVGHIVQLLEGLTDGPGPHDT